MLSNLFVKASIRLGLLLVLLAALCQFFIAERPLASGKETMAVLPFEVYAVKPMDHLKLGLQEMLTARLKERGYNVVDPNTVNRHPMSGLEQYEPEDLIQLGKDIGSDRIVVGSATQIGKKVSVDLKVVDISGGTPSFVVFVVADNLDALANATERIALSIDHKISGVIQVDSVEVYGNMRVEKEAIMAVIRTEKGDMFDPEKLDKDLRDIYKMGYFTDVQIETEDGPKGKRVRFKVVEKPSVARIIFIGNEELKSDDLREELGIEPYAVLDQNEIKQSINRLKAFYRNKGYYNVDITERIEPMPGNEVLLKYEITEKGKVYIDKIEFVGNEAFDDGDLKDIMLTSEKGFFPWLSWLTERGYLDQQKLDFDLHKITSFYHNHGFINARLGEPDISYKKGRGLHITIEVREGEQYSTGDVMVKGDLIRPPDELKEELNIGEERVFNRSTVRKDIKALKNVYADEGYAYAQVVPRTKENNEKLLVDITYVISKEEKVRFERINITGNTYTRDRVIRRELRILEGDYFSSYNLKRSNENLDRLGYFEDVQIQTKKGSADDLMVVDVSVKEKRTGSFSFGAGYSSQDSIFGVFEVSQRNLFGYGQKLSATGKLGGRSSQFDLSFSEPWLFGIPLSAGFRAYKWEREYDEYTKDSFGGSIGAGYPLRFGRDEFTRISLMYGYEDADISDVDDYAADVIREMEGRNVTSSTTFTIKRDSRDKPWNTSKGSVNSISVEYAGGMLGGDVSFVRYQAASAWYFPFFWETVFFVRGNWGYIQETSDDEIPTYQKYRIGGINTVRGFEYGYISPIDPESGDRIGGTRMMFYNFEYRFPLFKDQGMVGLVFFDAGDVIDDNESFAWSDMRTSVGTGIRWYSPVGPIRIEYGKNLDPRDDEESGKWEFTVGGSF